MADTAPKLAVTLWNYKGGVGKSTISLILAEIAAQQGIRTLAIDLDEQRNLVDTLSLTGGSFQALEVRTSLSPDCADEDFCFFVIDTHPAKDDTVMRALQFSDIVLIPMFGDYYSIMNIRSVFSYAAEAGLGNEQAVIVKNCMGNTKTSLEIENAIDTQGYPSAWRLSRNNLLVRNIASGYRWDRSLRDTARKPFLDLYTAIWAALAVMQSGNFSNLWRQPCQA